MTVDRIKDTTEIYFPELGWRFHIDPTAFTVGGIAIQWYGILITTGLILHFCIVSQRCGDLVLMQTELLTLL